MELNHPWSAPTQIPTRKGSPTTKSKNVLGMNPAMMKLQIELQDLTRRVEDLEEHQNERKFGMARDVNPRNNNPETLSPSSDLNAECESSENSTSSYKT